MRGITLLTEPQFRGDLFNDLSCIQKWSIAARKARVEVPATLLQRVRTVGREGMLCKDRKNQFGDEGIQCRHHVVRRVVWKIVLVLLLPPLNCPSGPTRLQA